MRMPHWQQVDLNLLGPLVALLDERHVSRAAVRAHMSQPAMSRALARLRETLGDELLVRGSRGYELTPRAERLQRQLAAVLPGLEVVFAAEEFDPRSAAETFRLAGTDYMVLLFGPTLFSRIFDASPQSSLTFSTWHGAVFDDLEHGAVDLLFAGVAPPRHLRSQYLFTEPFVCVMSADNPLSGRSQLSLGEYLDCAHVVVNVLDGTQSAIDRHLSALGTSRLPALRVPYHFAAAPAVIGNHLVATLPERLVARSGSNSALRVVRPPAEIEPMTYSLSWHPRVHEDPAQRWLRSLVVDTVRATLEAGDTEPAWGTSR